MRAMEEALGMSIACIDTKDFDVMEEVSTRTEGLARETDLFRRL
jgi:hypothetical protein